MKLLNDRNLNWFLQTLPLLRISHSPFCHFSSLSFSLKWTTTHSRTLTRSCALAHAVILRLLHNYANTLSYPLKFSLIFLRKAHAVSLSLLPDTYAHSRTQAHLIVRQFGRKRETILFWFEAIFSNSKSTEQNLVATGSPNFLPFLIKFRTT